MLITAVLFESGYFYESTVKQYQTWQSSKAFRNWFLQTKFNVCAQKPVLTGLTKLV